MEHVHITAAGNGSALAAGSSQQASEAGGSRGPYLAARRAGWCWFVGAGLALAGLYAITLSLLNGAAYAWESFAALWYWMAPLVLGFALQVGLFGYSRSLARAGVSPHASGVVASGGMSAASMVACCAHHLTDVLPLVGLAGIALFLGSYQSLFLLAGVLSNLVGITLLLGEMQKHQLYDRQGPFLSPVMRLPLRRALPYAAGAAALVFSAAFYMEVWA